MKKIYAGVLLAASLLFAPPGDAQLRLPGGGLGGLPDLSRPLLRDSPLRQRIDQTLAPADLPGLRQRLTEQLLERHPRELTRGPDGSLIVRQQVLALPSSQAARAQLLALPGVTLLEETRLDGLDLGWLLLRADVASLPRLRELDPLGDYDLQHVYLGSGEVDATPRRAGRTTETPALAASARVGLIDSGIRTIQPCAAPPSTVTAARGSRTRRVTVRPSPPCWSAEMSATAFAAPCPAPRCTPPMPTARRPTAARYSQSPRPWPGWCGSVWA